MLLRYNWWSGYNEVACMMWINYIRSFGYNRWQIMNQCWRSAGLRDIRLWLYMSPWTLYNVNIHPWCHIFFMYRNDDTWPPHFPRLISLSPSLHIILFSHHLLFFTSYSSLPRHILLALVISKLDLCEGGSSSTVTFSYVFTPFHVNISCLFVTLLKATYADNSHIVLSCRY